jgi:hypothetical protein
MKEIEGIRSVKFEIEPTRTVIVFSLPQASRQRMKEFEMAVREAFDGLAFGLVFTTDPISVAVMEVTS